jgi:hypothetical protein
MISGMVLEVIIKAEHEASHHQDTSKLVID